MSDPIPPPVPTPRRPQSGSPQRSWLPIIPIIGGMLLLLAAAALILFIGLRTLLHARESRSGMPLEVTRLAPTPTAAPMPATGCEMVVGSGDVQVAMPLPISLTVGSRSFAVVAVTPGPGEYPSGQAGTVGWVCGTVVNYVIGLEPLAENEALLTGLRPGDGISLLFSNGAEFSFRFTEQREAATYDASVLDQFRPSLTLIVEKASGGWRIATADYVAQTRSAQLPPETLVQPGQPVRAGDAQVTVVRGHAERDVAGLAPETMVYLVEFTVENVGTAPLDANVFNMELRDGLGNTYLLSPAASAFGESGVLGGEIAPGAVAQGSAGYLVPDTLVGPLTWIFSPRPGAEPRAGVSIPYEAPTTGGVGQAQVSLTDAFLSSDGALLLIEGEVRNVGNGPLTVELSDISLSSSAGMGSLRAAAPPLPWVIQPGQVQIIELQYERPAAPTVLLTVKGFSFEIAGLQ